VDVTKGGFDVDKPAYDAARQRLYINKEQYFSPVPLAAWGFHIGGYQVLDSTFRTLFRPSEAILEGPPAEIGGGLYTHYCMRYNPLLLHRFLLNHNFL